MSLPSTLSSPPPLPYPSSPPLYPILPSSLLPSPTPVYPLPFTLPYPIIPCPPHSILPLFPPPPLSSRLPYPTLSYISFHYSPHLPCPAPFHAPTPLNFTLPSPFTITFIYYPSLSYTALLHSTPLYPTLPYSIQLSYHTFSPSPLYPTLPPTYLPILNSTPLNPPLPLTLPYPPLYPPSPNLSSPLFTLPYYTQHYSILLPSPYPSPLATLPPLLCPPFTIPYSTKLHSTIPYHTLPFTLPNPYHLTLSLQQLRSTPLYYPIPSPLSYNTLYPIPHRVHILPCTTLLPSAPLPFTLACLTLPYPTISSTQRVRPKSLGDETSRAERAPKRLGATMLGAEMSRAETSWCRNVYGRNVLMTNV